MPSPDIRLTGYRPDVWISDRYAGQQELGKEHQVCLAHVLRDVQYAIDCGDRAFAPKVRDHLRWAIRIGKRRSSLKDTTLAAYCAKADTVLTRLMRMPSKRQILPTFAYRTSWLWLAPQMRGFLVADDVTTFETT
jgi:hypothetical protein